MFKLFILFLYLNCYSTKSILDFSKELCDWLASINPIFHNQQIRENLLNPVLTVNDNIPKYLPSLIINIHLLPLYLEAMIETRGLIFFGLECANIHLEEVNID